MNRFTVGLARMLVLGAIGAAAATAPAPALAQFRLPMKLEELERRAHADSNDPAAHFNVGLAYWNAKRWADVDSALRTAIRLDPRFAPAYVALRTCPTHNAGVSGTKSANVACRTNGSRGSRNPTVSFGGPT